MLLERLHTSVSIGPPTPWRAPFYRGWVTARTVVALLFEQGTLLIIATPGALKAGKTYAPLDPRAPQAVLSASIKELKPDLALAGGGPLRTARGCGADALTARRGGHSATSTTNLLTQSSTPGNGRHAYCRHGRFFCLAAVVIIPWRHFLQNPF